jgi:hypothetical protein
VAACKAWESVYDFKAASSKKKVFLIARSCPRLLGEHVQKVSQKLTAWIGKEIFFPLCLGRKEAAHSSQK